MQVRIFTFTNELTKSLELLTLVGNNSLLRRELLANVSLHRIHTSKCLLILRGGMKKPSSANWPVCVTMILGVYAAFTDLIDPNVIRGLLRPFPLARGTRILVLLVALNVAKTHSQVVNCVDIIEEFMPTLFKGDQEIDYLVLNIMGNLAKRDGLSSLYIDLLQQSLPPSPSLVLVPKLVLLAAYTSLSYQVPLEAITSTPITLRLRILDAIAIAGVHCTTERLLEIVPLNNQEFATIFKQYLIREEFSAPEPPQNLPLVKLYHEEPPLQRITQILSQNLPPAETVAIIHKLIFQH
ncbi:hypothetical protein NEHOM01_1553 [Nematocida homosporus]|uniref:uncharacterized protein n=1 Tax=Nematocida homosporus TaxID=1912981 RepID=UPI00221E811B|nr:uncharacterized protein NEHOM01_1553 [Nematocida homosporus]KAI5186567.1 hypothetical protein NEHOM01_1553 [Nematocida homosporus]